jgi:hypothetical protein
VRNRSCGSSFRTGHRVVVWHWGTVSMYYFSRADPGRLVRSHPWTEKLLALDECRPVQEPWIPRLISRVATPLKPDQWEEALEGHPDHRFRDYIIRGISRGFRIGFNRQLGSAPRSCWRNTRSAYEHPEVVSEYLARECRAARVLGPFRQCLSYKSAALGLYRSATNQGNGALSWTCPARKAAASTTA